MQSSDKKVNHPIVKLFIALAIFLVTAGLISGVIIKTFFNSQASLSNDLNIRKSYAGTIDTLFVGASQVKFGVVPNVIDPIAKTSSFTLACTWQNLYGSKLLLKEELSRNPVKHVYLGVCLDTLTRTEDVDQGQGDIAMIPRLSGASAKLDYILHTYSFGDISKMYYFYMHRGALELKYICLGTQVSWIDANDRGYVPYGADEHDFDGYTGGLASLSYYEENGITEENKKQFTDLVKTCVDAGADVTVFATPLTDRFLTHTDIWQKFLDEVKELADEAAKNAGISEIPIADFNLYKGRRQIFDDYECFYNWNHMNPTGAARFSEIFANYIAGNKEMFYNNYNEMFESEY